jgi:hypothetical protein
VEGLQAFDSVGIGFYTTAFIRLADIPTDAQVRVINSFCNLDNPVGLLIENSSDDSSPPWKGLFGILVRGNRFVSSGTGIRLVNGDATRILSNFIAGSSVAGLGIDAASAVNLIRGNRFQSNGTNVADLGFLNCYRNNRYDTTGPTQCVQN